MDRSFAAQTASCFLGRLSTTTEGFADISNSPKQDIMDFALCTQNRKSHWPNCYNNVGSWLSKCIWGFIVKFQTIPFIFWSVVGVVQDVRRLKDRDQTQKKKKCSISTKLWVWHHLRWTFGSPSKAMIEEFIDLKRFIPSMFASSPKYSHAFDASTAAPLNPSGTLQRGFYYSNTHTLKDLFITTFFFSPPRGGICCQCIFPLQLQIFLICCHLMDFAWVPCQPISGP